MQKNKVCASARDGDPFGCAQRRQTPGRDVRSPADLESLEKLVREGREKSEKLEDRKRDFEPLGTVAGEASRGAKIPRQLRMCDFPLSFHLLPNMRIFWLELLEATPQHRRQTEAKSCVSLLRISCQIGQYMSNALGGEIGNLTASTLGDKLGRGPVRSRGTRKMFRSNAKQPFWGFDVAFSRLRCIETYSHKWCEQRSS